MTTRTIEDYEVLEPDWYNAVLRDIEESEEDGPYGPYLTWTFGVLTDDGEVEVEARSADSWKGNTKPRAWYGAVLGRPMTNGEDIEFAAVIGKPCRINVSVIKSEKGIEYNRITEVASPKVSTRPKAVVNESADDVPF